MKNTGIKRLYSVGSILAIVFLAACSGSDSKQLSESETNEIENILLEAIKTNKITAYADGSMQNEVSFSSIERMIPLDSNGRQDLSGFGVITEEEVAIKNGDFMNESRKLAGVLLMTEIRMGGEGFVLPLASLQWKSVKKALKKDLQDKLKASLLDFLAKNDTDYVAVITELRRQEVTKSLFLGLEDGSIAAYENENMAHVISPTELPDYDTRKEVIQVPDVQFPGEFKDTLIRTSRTADDMVDFTPHYDESGKLMAISLVYLLEAQDITVKIPWVCVSMDDVVANIDQSMVGYLQKRYGAKEESGNEAEPKDAS